MIRSLSVLLICVACFIGHHSVGQVKFGVKGGLNMAKVKFDQDNTDYILKFNIGAQARFALGEKFYLQPEVVYSQKGYQIEIVDDDATITFNYLSVPILVGYQVSKFSFFLGPEMSFKLGVNTSPGGKWENDPYEDFDIGAAVGSTYSINSQVGIDLRYVHGFKEVIIANVRDENNVPLGEFKDGNHRLIQLSVFYFFNKGQD